MATFSSWDDALRTLAWIVDPDLFWNNTQSTNQTNIQPFNTYDNLTMQSKAWSNTNPNLSEAYSSLADWLWRYSNVAKQIWGFYDATANAIAQREWDYANAQYQLANQLNQDIANQRNYINSVFWPNGSLTQEINKYYDDMWNYLASEGWRQMANVAAQWIHSWASLWLLRAQQNEAYNNAFQNYLKIKEQEINAKQSIQAQLIDYMTKLRQEYGNTTNQYILWQYQRANDLLNSLNSDLQNQYTNLALAQIQGSWSGSSSWSASASASSPLVDALNPNNQSADSTNNLDSNNQNTNKWWTSINAWWGTSWWWTSTWWTYKNWTIYQDWTKKWTYDSNWNIYNLKWNQIWYVWSDRKIHQVVQNKNKSSDNSLVTNVARWAAVWGNAWLVWTVLWALWWAANYLSSYNK